MHLVCSVFQIAELKHCREHSRFWSGIPLLPVLSCAFSLELTNICYLERLKGISGVSCLGFGLQWSKVKI